MAPRFWEWLRGRKPLVDAFLVAPVLVLVFPVLLGNGPDLSGNRYVAVTAALLVPMVLRRTFPRTVFAVVAAVSFVQWALHIPVLPANIAILMGIYTVTAGCAFRWGVATALIGELGTLMATLRYPVDANDRKFTFLAMTAVVAGVWILGLHMRTRRAYLRSVEERAERLERERDAEVQMAMAAERGRIARELHDVIAHNVSVIVVQADGASYAINTDVVRARQALETISSTGRLALGEMRRLLGVLREDDDAGEYAPQPGVAQLDDLVEQLRASGLSVTMGVDGSPAAMSEGRQLTVFRIVQEALTNTLKHGGLRVSAHVRLCYAGDTVEIRVVDDGRGAAAVNDGRGHGLVGMRERAAVYGGSVRAAPRPGGGFEVVARIPVREAA
ncbi:MULTISPECIES: sensor histidine kinase [Actinomadura]|uniref:histidine kinase n=1 Tax=Actinomadura litoris TaxID=2678616 RepID=A0A7K1KUA3_9ACTN|nr:MULTISPECIES: histidine kinase [Actinomadura]MBT2207591.1 sensor histidine kinase [Actinomadura sp. NEAU-AAG7]MUN35615.1 sensor histidine kinase [Actinomadura litoris]